MNRLHHAAIVPANFEKSLEFYRDGIGLDILADFEVAGQANELFDAANGPVHTVMLGHPERRDAGVIELAQWTAEEPPEPQVNMQPAHGSPRAGFFLLAFHADVLATCARLRERGYSPRQVETDSRTGRLRLATVRDPDGILIELLQFVDARPQDYEVED